jgi:hypothetical protein
MSNTETAAKTVATGSRRRKPSARASHARANRRCASSNRLPSDSVLFMKPSAPLARASAITLGSAPSPVKITTGIAGSSASKNPNNSMMKFASKRKRQNIE